MLETGAETRHYLPHREAPGGIGNSLTGDGYYVMRGDPRGGLSTSEMNTHVADGIKFEVGRDAGHDAIRVITNSMTYLDASHRQCSRKFATRSVPRPRPDRLHSGDTRKWSSQ
jgi:hypothetical protein